MNLKLLIAHLVALSVIILFVLIVKQDLNDNYINISNIKECCLNDNTIKYDDLSNIIYCSNGQILNYNKNN